MEATLLFIRLPGVESKISPQNLELSRGQIQDFDWLDICKVLRFGD